MSKFTKLVNNPKSFFVDAYSNKKKKLSNHINVDRVEEFLTKPGKKYLSKVGRNNHDASEMNSHYFNDILNEEYSKVKKKYDTVLLAVSESKEDNSSDLLKYILQSEINYALLLAFKKYKLYNHNIFNPDLISCYLSQNSELEQSIVQRLLKVVGMNDHIDITNYIGNRFTHENFISYSSSIKALVKFIEGEISENPNRVVLLGENNLKEINSTAVNAKLFNFYLSNFMAYKIFVDRSVDFSILDSEEKLYWWWVTCYLPTNKLTADFIPPEILSYFSEISFKQESLKIGLSNFFHQVYQKDDSYKSRYDILNPIDFMGFSLDVYLNNLNNPVNSKFISEDIGSILFKPFVYENFSINLFEILLYMSKMNDFTLEKFDINLMEKLKEEYVDHLPFHTSSNYFNTLIKKKSLNQIDNKIRLVGLYHSTTGLGVNLKMMSNMLRMANIEHEIFDINTKEVFKVSGKNSIKPKKSCNIYMINADMIGSNILSVDQQKDTVNIGFLLWELEEVPNTHMLALDFLDQIWVPTVYLENIYSKYTNTPIICVKKFLEKISATNSKPSMEPFRFYTSFDFHSNIERKNPLAAVLAFKNAFKNGEKVEFILKTTDIIRHHPGNHKQQWERIIMETSNDSRFVILSGKIPFQDLINQINSSHCVVSSHRSEGFGYLPAHALMLSKPVILTDYSGTTDFCNIKTSYPVSWIRKELELGDFGDHVRGGFWADVDVLDMSDKMYEVYTKYDVAVTRANVGKEYLKNEYSFEKFSLNCINALKSIKVL